MSRRKKKKIYSAKELNQLYSKFAKKAIRNGTEIIKESLPPFLHKVLEEKRKRRLASKLDRCRKWNLLDPKVYIHKWYPWCYKNYIPTMVLQGWYDVKFAKKYYIKNYGPDALKHVKFVRGSEALQREFDIGISLYINYKWVRITDKLPISTEARLINRTGRWKTMNKQDALSLRDKKKYVRPEKLEQVFIKSTKIATYGKRSTLHYIPKISAKKRLDLQEIRKTKFQRQKEFYEE